VDAYTHAVQLAGDLEARHEGDVPGLDVAVRLAVREWGQEVGIGGFWLDAHGSYYDPWCVFRRCPSASGAWEDVAPPGTAAKVVEEELDRYLSGWRKDR